MTWEACPKCNKTLNSEANVEKLRGAIIASGGSQGHFWVRWRHYEKACSSKGGCQGS